MREEARIKRILELIEKKWMTFPDSRFGQLLINIGICADDNRLWHVEDDLMEKHLKEVLKKKW
jgi:hypothetical protein